MSVRREVARTVVTVVVSFFVFWLIYPRQPMDEPLDKNHMPIKDYEITYRKSEDGPAGTELFLSIKVGKHEMDDLNLYFYQQLRQNGPSGYTCRNLEEWRIKKNKEWNPKCGTSGERAFTIKIKSDHWTSIAITNPLNSEHNMVYFYAMKIPFQVD